jgi:hypothetical protein
MKLDLSRQIFEKYSSAKFHKNPFNRSSVIPCGRTDRRNEAKSSLSQFHDSAYKSNSFAPMRRQTMTSTNRYSDYGSVRRFSHERCTLQAASKPIPKRDQTHSQYDASKSATTRREIRNGSRGADKRRWMRTESKPFLKTLKTLYDTWVGRQWGIMSFASSSLSCLYLVYSAPLYNSQSSYIFSRQMTQFGNRLSPVWEVLPSGMTQRVYTHFVRKRYLWQTAD